MEFFDPEKVEHTEGEAAFKENGEDGKWYSAPVVRAADYDALLALYRKAMEALRP
jgi:hypothetical protein